ncbi:hypothetical protein [Marinobacter halophilus]|uniref:hypothetical protein n=1 Tax=Marinobacter halophilus TaxID=1323740 RepID=UPI001D0F6CE2|nr:hypothetical protein [Marinobacter halophilus]
MRRTFLCGQDRATGRSYEHRRGWIEERIRLLASVFAVDVAAYAVMSNHYHLVVKLSPDDVEPWSIDEVLARWCSLYKGPPLVQRYHRGDELCAAEFRRVEEYAETFRLRLADLSWFMKCLNEPIARQANREDECTGRISRSDKRGAIGEKALPILKRLNLDPERWCHRATAFEDSYQDYRNPGRRRQAA